MSVELMTRPAEWEIEQSHLVRVPVSLHADSLADLRSRVQAIADDNSDPLPFGEILFKYQTDDNNEVIVAHCYFLDRHSKQRRFMRLRRQ